MTIPMPKSRTRNSTEKLSGFIQEFFTRFPSEEDSQRHIYEKLKQQMRARCRHCNNSEFDTANQLRAVTCSKCGNLWWITAGTFFEGSRNLHTWLLLIWLIEQGVDFNPNQLSKLINSNYSSVYMMMQKIKLVIDKNLVTCGEISSSEFESLYARRTSETPARAHPRAEEEEAVRQRSQPVDVAVEETVSDTVSIFGEPTGEDLQSSEQVLLLDILKGSDCIHFDTLSSITGMPAGALSAKLALMEIAGLVVYKPGDWYSAAKPKKNSEQSAQCKAAATFTAQFEKFIRETSQKIGRKYVQLYVSLLCCLQDKSRWFDGELLNVCLGSPAINDHNIRRYVSDVCIKIGPPLQLLNTTITN